MLDTELHERARVASNVFVTDPESFNPFTIFGVGRNGYSADKKPHRESTQRTAKIG